MKYSQLSSYQKDAINDIINIALSSKIEDEKHFTRWTIRMPLIGNAAGIAILAAFMGNLASNSSAIFTLTGPLSKFIIGLIFGAITYFPLFIVSSQATYQTSNQIMKFLKDEIKYDEIIGWGLNRRGKLIILFLQLCSLGFFSYGLFQCIQVIKSLAAK